MARRLHTDASMQTGANKAESRGTAQSIFMPSTMKAVRIHARGGPEFLKYIVSCTYPLTDARKAFEASRTHKAPGKVILQVR